MLLPPVRLHACIFGREIDTLCVSAQEINYLWRKPKIRSSYWFFLNRYFAFFGNIVVVILGFSNLTVRVRMQAFLSFLPPLT